MVGGTRKRWLAVLVGALLLSASVAGCIGAGDEEPEDLEASQAESESAANETDAVSNASEEEVVFEEETVTFEGSGTGVGVGATGSNFWIVGQGIFHDFTPPETFEEGTVTLEWDGLESQGGMWILIRDSDGESVHVFEAESSPYEETLDADDERLQGAAEIVVAPDQGVPATAHVEVAFNGSFTFSVPSQTA